MGIKKEKREEIIKSILKKLPNHPNDIVKVISEESGLSRQTINKYIKTLIEDDIVEATGIKRNINYKLKEHILCFSFRINENTDESSIWAKDVLPNLPPLPKNVLDICLYGFTEILNNVIDHSDSEFGYVALYTTALSLKFWIIDQGVGIFNKIQKHFGLQDPKQSILELSKGKLTSDPSRHSGEGIFFTSRMFDKFVIVSHNLTFNAHDGNDWIMEDSKEVVPDRNKGTAVLMQISLDSSRDINEVFNRYSNDDFGFSKTMVPVKLLQYEGMELISRSQAKRLIMRFDRFQEVILNFEGIKLIGQAFADELFRVFNTNHPNTHLAYVNANENVEKMIKHVLNAK